VLPFAEILDEENEGEVLAVNTDHFDRLEFINLKDTSGYVIVPAFGYCRVNTETLSKFQSQQQVTNERVENGFSIKTRFYELVLEETG
jgi:hypothetical protein